MSGLTDWVPNAHALIVHLPIGLLVTAFAAELRGPAAASSRAGRRRVDRPTPRAG